MHQSISIAPPLQPHPFRRVFERLLWFFLAVLVWCSACSSSVQGQVYPELVFQDFYGTTGPDQPHALAKGLHGDLYLAGAVPDANECTDGLVIAVSPEGREQWRRRLGGAECDAVRSLAVTGRGELFYAGYTGSNLQHPDADQWRYRSDYLVGKLRPTGAPLWRKALGGSRPDQAYGVVTTTTGGGAVVGSSWSEDYEAEANTAPLNDLWMLLLDAEGDVLRSKSFGGRKNDWGMALTHGLGADYWVAAMTNSEDLDGSTAKHNGDGWLLNLTESGHNRWNQVIKEPYEEVLMDIAMDSQGRVAAVGSSYDPELGKQFWLVILGQRGELVVNKKWGGGGFEQLNAIAPCTGGGFVLTGFSQYVELEMDEIKGREDCWVFRVDHEGEIIWQNTYGGPDNEKGVDILEYQPGAYYVLAQKANTFDNKANTGQDDFWLFRIDEKNCSEINPLFDSDLKSERIKVGVPIRFFNKTQSADRYLWDFGDGTFSQDTNPVKVYEKPGVYLVRLKAFKHKSCQDEYAYPRPIIVTLD